MRNLLIYIFLIALISCNGSKKKEVENLQKEVFAIHDEVMLKTGSIMSLSKNIKMLASEDSLDTNKYTEVMEHLTSADSAMMAWMHGFDPVMTDMSLEDKKNYLLEEKKKMLEVKALTDSSISEANQILGN